jgi:hypothetical protein
MLTDSRGIFGEFCPWMGQQALFRGRVAARYRHSEHPDFLVMQDILSRRGHLRLLWIGLDLVHIREVTGSGPVSLTQSLAMKLPPKST